jgi:hypothetical protein
MFTMNPVESSQSVKLNLPPPVIESGMVGTIEVSKNPISSNETSELLPQSKNLPTDTTFVQASNLPIPISIPQDDSIVAQTTTNIVAPSTADDSDLIEKEWVIKAKKIVEFNSADPYNQTREINLFRADYMKKRYNKIIKINE